MPLLYPVGFGSIRFRWRLSGDPDEINSTMAFRSDASAAEVANAVTFEMTQVGAFPAGEMVDAYTFIGVIVQKQVVGAVEEAESTVNIVGTVGSDPPPQNVAILVEKNTGLAGRENRGRAFWPPAYIGEESIAANGVLDAAFTGPFNDSLEQVRIGLAGHIEPIILCVAHGFVGPDPTDITSLTVDPVVATQRRRLR